MRRKTISVPPRPHAGAEILANTLIRFALSALIRVFGGKTTCKLFYSDGLDVLILVGFG